MHNQTIDSKKKKKRFGGFWILRLFISNCQHVCLLTFGWPIMSNMGSFQFQRSFVLINYTPKYWVHNLPAQDIFAHAYFSPVNVPEKHLYLYLEVVYKHSTTTVHLKLPYKMNFLKEIFSLLIQFWRFSKLFPDKIFGEKNVQEREEEDTPIKLSTLYVFNILNIFNLSIIFTLQ